MLCHENFFSGLIYLMFSYQYECIFPNLKEVFSYDLVEYLTDAIDLGFFSLIYACDSKVFELCPTFSACSFFFMIFACLT